MKLLAFVCALTIASTNVALADDSPDTQAKINALQSQLDAVKAQLEQLKAQQAAPAQTPASAAAAASPEKSSPQSTSFLQLQKGKNVTFLVGGDPVQLYGNLDLSLDYTTKGLNQSYPDPGAAGAFVSPVGNMGYMTGLSTNLSYVGLRGVHKLDKVNGLVWQLETQIDVSSTSGFANTNSNTDSAVKGGLTSRNSYVGISGKSWGALKFGKTDAPYKSSTGALNPFSGELGDYSVIMGNSGGDNRVEFAARLDHALWYESPNLAGFKVNLLVSPGQNRSYDNSNIAAGEVDCAGGNLPGSGATPPYCGDGSYGTVYSGNVAYKSGPLYLTTAYELHKKVNRATDLAVYDPNDVADEQALKFGAQYAVTRSTTVNAIYEDMARYVPSYLQYQNERSRNGWWLALTQKLNLRDSLNFGWAHAGATPGDPGQHNTPGGANPDNMANMYTVAFKHALDKHTLWYMDWALTANHADAHFDLGAGGRGLTTDCHDATQLTAFDATTNALISGSGPHCYAGGHLQGFSTGLKVSF